jgi:signal transduction histidine kinase
MGSFIRIATCSLFASDAPVLTVVCSIPSQVVAQELAPIVWSVTVIFSVLLGGAVVSSLLISRWVSQPIKELTRAVTNVSVQRLDLDLDTKLTGTRDEIGVLAEAFQKMLTDLKDSTTSIDNLNREITARRKTDQALAAANEQLAQTVQNLRRLNKELQDFAHVTAHDLKAPLRGIGTLADWIASDYADKLDEPGRQQLRLLKGRVVRRTELINGILHYSEIGRVTNRWETVDLDNLVPEMIALLDPPAHIQVLVAGPLPTVVCEKVRLGQVFHNLIDNAIKYMDKPQGRIEVRCADQGRTSQFAVSDNGPGIEEKYFEKIFQMFQTLVPRDQRESTGIGLPIVKKIVELFGGRIWVESKPGAGATFFFTLPKCEAAAPREPLAPAGASLN